MVMSSYRVIVMVCALAQLSGTFESAAAQPREDASLRVTARDATGAVIVGATVELTRPSEDSVSAVPGRRGAQPSHAR